MTRFEVVFSKIEDYTVDLTGKTYEYVVLVDEKETPQIIDVIASDKHTMGPPLCHSYENQKLYQFKRSSPLDSNIWAQVSDLHGVIHSWAVDPVFYIQKGKPLFSSALEILEIAREKKHSLGQAALIYESEILGLSEGS